MLLIHFGADFGANDATEDGRASQMPLLAEALLVDWYCRWADERVSPVFVLFPESRRAQIAPVLPEVEHASPVWYTDDGASLLPGIRRRGLVWIANGRHLPVVDWNAARSAARRHNTDVLIFGSSDAPAPHYLESVLVDDAGEVVRFKRHYCDSPGFTDLWDGEASFLTASGERAAAVVTHMLTRGWGLDSIGALTRRFSVQWSSTPCVLSEFGVTSSSLSGPTELGGQSRGWPGDPQCEWTAGQRTAVCSLSRFPEARAKTTLATADPPGHDSPGHDEDAPLTRRVSDPQAEERVSAPPGDLSEVESGDPVTDLDDAPAVSDSETPERPAGDRAYLFLKRSIDLIASAVGIIVLSPLLLAVAATVRLTSPGPALFGDRRQGLGGKEFRCLKFRSMQKGASALQAKLRSRN